MKNRRLTVRDTMTADTVPEPPVVACLDRSRHAGRVLDHALTMAALLGAPLRVVQAIEQPTRLNNCPDPLDWAINRLEACETLKAAVSAVVGAEDADVIDVSLLHGNAADEIRRDCRRQKAGLVVMGMHGERDVDRANGPGATVRAVIEGRSGMVLVVPDMADAQRCRSILVPMDGSCWSETALPVAVRLARAASAEVTLVQVVVVAEPASNLPQEPEDLDLRARLVARDERVARAHLEQLTDALADQGIKARSLAIRGEDVRVALSALLGREAFDLVVMSASGHGSARLPGRGCGGVAAHLAGNSPAPVLIVRRDTAHLPRSVTMTAPDAPHRLPTPPVESRRTVYANGDAR